MIEKAFILAAGYGTRLRPMTNFIPKPLFPIVGRPAIEIVMSWINRFGVMDFHINAHHLSSKLNSAFDNGTLVPSDANANLIIERNEILGTAGGLGNLFHSAAEPDCTILIHNGDVIESFDLDSTYRKHIEHGAAVTMLLVNNHTKNSVVTENDAVVRFSKGMGLTYSGVAFMEPEVLKSFPDDKFASITDCLEQWIETRSVMGLEMNGFWCDFGTPELYLGLHKDILVRNLHPDIVIDGTQWISPNAKIHSDSIIDGFVAIGDGAEIPDKCRLENCIVWDRTVVPSANYRNAIITPYAIVNVDK